MSSTELPQPSGSSEFPQSTPPSLPPQSLASEPFASPGPSAEASPAESPAAALPPAAAPAEPAIVQFNALGLAPSILRALDELGYRTPTPIQSQAIPHVLRGIDLLGGAQTGTGKTAAFALPMLQRLLPYANNSVSPARHQVRALILAPTRELAMQVEESVRDYARHTQLRAVCVFGGVSIDPQIAQLRAGVEIVVATPGRLLDHLQQKTVSLSQVEYLVLDEADRMLDMGFLPDIKRILALLPERRQSLLFSATFPEEVKRLSEQLLKSPIRIEVARPNATAETISHTIHRCDELQKRALLSHLVRTRGITQALVFTRTKQAARRLARSLQQEGVSAAEIHSDKTQAERMQALADFKANRIALLVATDIAARGIDIDNLPHVINFELPQSAEDYVHRIGRTGRAGMLGEAISLVSPAETEMLASIEKLIKRKLPIAEVADWHPDRQSSPRALGFSSAAGRDRPARADGDRGRSRSERGEARPAAPLREPQREADSGRERPAPARRRPQNEDPLFTSAYVPPPETAPAPSQTAAPQPGIVRKRRTQVAALLAAPPEPG
jgi:ATP-dependent RNA helicase RhlE